MSSEPPRHHVLVIDDDPVNLLVLNRALSRRGYEVTTADGAQTALAAIERAVPDIVLLDIFMPMTSGFDLLSELRRNALTTTVPVILISALSDTNHIVEGLDRGANDYVTKPVVIPILTARIEALLRASALVKHLEVQRELLAKLSAFDELTGVYNRRSLFHSLETELARSQRYKRSVAVAIAEIDRFEGLTAELGQAASDEILRQVAEQLQASVRTIDVVCRYGARSFCLILPETPLDGGLRAGERVRAALEQTKARLPTGEVAITVSIGVTAWSAEGGTPPDLLAEAEGAMQEASDSGMNRVVGAVRSGAA